MKRSMSAVSSRSGLARHTSSTWALARTCARPISAASSNWLGDDQLLEPPGADDVGALAHEDRPVVVGGIEHLDAAHRRAAPRRRGTRGGRPRARSRERADVRGRGAAAAADDVDPALVDEALHLEGEALRASRRTGRARRAARRWDSTLTKRVASAASERRWSVMNSGPVAQLSPMEKSVEVLEGHAERLHALAGQHRPGRLDGGAHHQRQLAARCPHRLPHADAPRP